MTFRAAIKRNLATIVRPATPAAARDAIATAPRSAVPVLRVADVAHTAAWYRRHLAFAVQSFPAQPPHEFALLNRDGAQLMIRRAPVEALPTTQTGWDVYIRVEGGELSRLYETLRSAVRIARPIEETPYGDVEFEVVDPDGHTLCLGESASITRM